MSEYKLHHGEPNAAFHGRPCPPALAASGWTAAGHTPSNFFQEKSLVTTVKGGFFTLLLVETEI